jgi:hypothetical protein
MLVCFVPFLSLRQGTIQTLAFQTSPFRDMNFLMGAVLKRLPQEAAEGNLAANVSLTTSPSKLNKTK